MVNKLYKLRFRKEEDDKTQLKKGNYCLNILIQPKKHFFKNQNTHSKIIKGDLSFYKVKNRDQNLDILAIDGIY